MVHLIHNKKALTVWLAPRVKPVAISFSRRVGSTHSYDPGDIISNDITGIHIDLRVRQLVGFLTKDKRTNLFWDCVQQWMKYRIRVCYQIRPT